MGTPCDGIIMERKPFYNKVALKSIEPVIDFKLIEKGEFILDSFNGKLTVLYASLNEGSKEDIEVYEYLDSFYYQQEEDLDIMEAYNRDIKIYEKELSFREMVNYHKKELFDVVFELTGKYPTFKNLECSKLFATKSIMFEDKKSYYKEILSNESIKLVYGELKYLNISFEQFMSYEEFLKLVDKQ